MEGGLGFWPFCMLCSRLVPRVGVRVFSFPSQIPPPAYTPIYASLTPSRESAQDSGPSGSLVLSRKNFAFSASCRFYPGAFINRNSTHLPCRHFYAAFTTVLSPSAFLMYPIYLIRAIAFI